MKVLSWNCRDLVKLRVVPVLKDILGVHKPGTLLLSKTLVHSNRVEEIRVALGFQKVFVVDKDGRSGGLALF